MAAIASASAEKFRQLGWCENGEAPVETTNTYRPAADAAPASMRAATSLFVLPINEQQHVSLGSLVDAPDPMARPSVRSRLVTESIIRPIDPEDITSKLRGVHHTIGPW